jgi:NAD(P)-dependent dehydrogenase (short-subunit alcohol dehydrogenase family)
MSETNDRTVTRTAATTTPTDPADADVMSLFRLDGMTAVVTGAGRGIGRGIALGLADAGADVVVTARRGNELDEVCARIAERGRQAVKVVADITSDEAVPQLIETATASFGNVDIWVSNAGGSEHDGKFAFKDFPEWHWDAQIGLNLRPHFVAARACMDVMRPGSSIIGISSIASLRAAGSFAAYGAAKAAMNHLTLTLSAELGPLGIRANAVSPGNVPTESTFRVGGVDPAMLPAIAKTIPLRRLGTPTDIAAAVVWLASPAGSWVTGQNIVVSGGQ